MKHVHNDPLDSHPRQVLRIEAAHNAPRRVRQECREPNPPICSAQLIHGEPASCAFSSGFMNFGLLPAITTVTSPLIVVPRNFSASSER